MSFIFLCPFHVSVNLRKNSCLLAWPYKPVVNTLLLTSPILRGQLLLPAVPSQCPSWAERGAGSSCLCSARSISTPAFPPSTWTLPCPGFGSAWCPHTVPAALSSIKTTSGTTGLMLGQVWTLSSLSPPAPVHAHFVIVLTCLFPDHKQCSLYRDTVFTSKVCSYLEAAKNSTNIYGAIT